MFLPRLSSQIKSILFGIIQFFVVLIDEDVVVLVVELFELKTSFIFSILKLSNVAVKPLTHCNLTLVAHSEAITLNSFNHLPFVNQLFVVPI